MTHRNARPTIRTRIELVQQVEDGWLLRIPRSTVYAVLRRAGLHRLAWLHRTTRTILRYERHAPGELLHLDVKKLGRIPPGGGKRFASGFKETRSGPHSRKPLGVDYLHVAVDDHSRYAYVEALPDEKGPTTAGFLVRTLAFFRALGVCIKRILTDNGKNYTSRLFRTVALAHRITLKLTRPYRPQTNGKAEAFIKILQNEWAYAREYLSNHQRLRELGRFMRYYNRRRPHGGIVPMPLGPSHACKQRLWEVQLATNEWVPLDRAPILVSPASGAATGPRGPGSSKAGARPGAYSRPRMARESRLMIPSISSSGMTGR